MAVRDTWNRALVYFGLAEDHDYRYEDEHDPYEPDTVSDEAVSPAPRRQRGASNVRRLRREEPPVDEIDDIFADDSVPRRRRNLRPVADAGADVQVHFVTPRNFNDAQEVADRFKRNVPVILNLQSTSADLSKRLIDFSSGLTYALDGGMQKIADKTFMLTPANVEVSAEEKARLVEKGFFNQS
ncbi:MAG: cell division protein SepF [Acidobacteria bacterium]|nr:MAG: cell division protein SepF [Acidobacteriota bacterium]MCL4286834.1 cell division protein SepF [Thermoleophilia bacterium]GIK78114.1 MAG: cell division protein SepF 2 [Actinomycetes bacterium]